MDRLKKARKPIRASFTRIVNELSTEIAKEESDAKMLRIKVTILEGLHKELNELDEKILNELLDTDCSEDDYLIEREGVEEYRMRWTAARINVEERLQPQSLRSGSPSASEISATSSVAENKRKTYKLPKIEIKKFDGELRQWLSFWSQFKKIHEDQELADSDKFQYLAQSMVKGSIASELVDGYPQTAANYPKVIQSLRERFGDDKLLKRVYVRELLRLVINNNTAHERIRVSQIFDKLESHLRALESLGITPDQMDVLLFPMVESCLPDDILTAWQRSANYGRDGATENPPRTEFDFMMQFIKQEVISEGQRRLARDGFGLMSQVKVRKEYPKQTKKSGNDKDDIPTAAGLFVSKEDACIFCEKPHLSQECAKARSMTLSDKKERIKVKRACYRCFRIGHSSAKCRYFVKCFLCKRDHHAIVCPDVQNTKETDRKEPSGAENTKITSTNLNCSNDVLLKTILVRMVGHGGQHVARLLLDDGSQRTYVKSSTVKKLKYKSHGVEEMQKSLFGGTVTEVRHHKKFQLQLRSLDGKISRELIALDEPVLCGQLPRVPMGPWVQELERKNIRLNDFVSDNPDIEILVGSDYWGSLITGKVMRLHGGLVAMETIFGWTLSGVVPKLNSAAMAITNALFIANASVEELWSLEALGIRDPTEVKTKKQIDSTSRRQFLETVTRNRDGRYCVTLPWADEGLRPPDNRRVAESRLQSATAKLHSEGRYDDYQKVFESWLKEDIIEEVKVGSPEKPSHYLPHRPVFKPESRTTPIRPVFDASSKSGRNPSLNDCLHKGPNLLELIPTLLLRFREGQIGLVSDVRKAFQMIEVRESDRDFQRFLWWEDSLQKTMKIYRHKRVVFGINCSPFLLSAVLEYHLNQVNPEDKPIAEKLLQAFYVDNCVTSVDTLQDYETFKSTSIRIMADANMELRQWERTSVELPRVEQATIEGFGLDDRREDIALASEQRSLTSVLGLKWDKVSDTLRCDFIQCELPEKLTKRIVLSQVQRLFDPIGFTCPVMLRPKLLLQKAWKDSKGWDEDLPSEAKTQFMRWSEELHYIQQLQIPRNVTGNINSREFWQIHVFSDASQDAYAAVVFLRTVDGEEVSVKLLQAKSRVAPLKKMTIPRLELMGCVIATRLLTSVKMGLGLADIPTYLWCDSTTALAWIQRNDNWGTFVGNRVREICQLQGAAIWRHVPGVLNPADLPSRGCDGRQLLKSTWWEGPEWLKEDEEKWPHKDVTVDEDAVNLEKKASSKVNVAVGIKSWYEPRYSSYYRNLRVIAWVRRFISNSRVTKHDRETAETLHISELRKAEHDVVRIIQSDSFPPGASKVQNVHVERMEDDLLHVKTRLTFREDTKEFRWPLLLPHSHPLVEQLIREAHRDYCHAGAQFLLGKLREKYWILQGRKAVRNIVHKCTRCQRFDAKPMQVDPAALPAQRVSNGEVFQNTGVDLTGPLSIKAASNEGTTKVWIVLYTCAIYRYVHMDVVSSLSTDAFIRSLERFVNTFGRPDTIFSDNGTNFVGSANLFRKLDWEKIEGASRVKQIQWVFNPPTAAWWGGWWERLIRSVKDLLRRILDKSKLSLDELRTCLASVGATINDRPLTTMTEDPDDLDPLTPAMFLRGTRAASFPEGEEVGGQELQTQYKRVKVTQKRLRDRFRKEYLAQLVQRASERKTPLPQVGDIVLVGADNKKRFEWPLGRILELLPGKDLKVRVAKVKISQGVILRPLQRLYPLEVSNPSNLPLAQQIKDGADFDEKERSTCTGVRQQSDLVCDPTTTRTRINPGRKARKPCRYEKWM